MELIFFLGILYGFFQAWEKINQTRKGKLSQTISYNNIIEQSFLYRSNDE
jgi:hypothetical protein